jgi:hypothetical protein
MANREQRGNREPKKAKKDKPKIAPSPGGRSTLGIIDKARAAASKK